MAGFLSNVLDTLNSTKVGGDLFRSLVSRRGREVTSITLEHGFIKLLVTQGLEVIDYRVSMANPQFFREGLVSDTNRMAAVLHTTLGELKGSHHRIIGSVPGYQGTMGEMELPRARDLDPAVVIPREAGRAMGISSDTSYLTWHRLPDNVDRSRWLVVSATRRSITALTNTIAAVGLPIRTLELRPFALARALNQPEAVIVWTAVDGTDVIVVRGGTPVAHQSAYWGADPVGGSILVNRLTELVGQTIETYNELALDTALPDATPLYITGTPAGLDRDVGQQVAANLGRQAEAPVPPLTLPEGFPLDDLIVNVGLALWQA